MRFTNIALLLSTLCLSTFSYAASYEESFKQASVAFKNGDFDKAGTLFLEAGDLLSKKDINKAVMIWGNAAIANVKANDYQEAAEIYDKILNSKAKLSIEQRIKFTNGATVCYGNLNQYALQIKSVESILKYSKQLPSETRALFTASSADAYRNLELYRSAAQAYEKALKDTPKKDLGQRALVLTALGLCQGNLGNYNDAISNLTEANKLAQQLGQKQTIAETFSNLGILHWEKGDYEQAIKFLNQAIDVESKEKFERNLGSDKNNLGLVYKSMGNYPEAMKNFQQSANIAKKLEIPRDQGIAVVNQALVYRINGDYKKAESLYSSAISLFNQAEFKEGLAGAYLGVGKMVEVADQDYALAIDYYEKALKLYTELDLNLGRTETLLQLGNVYLEHIKSSEDSASTRDLSFEDEPSKPIAASKEEALQKAAGYLNQAYELASKGEIKELLWRAHQYLGYVDYQNGKLESADDHYTKAIDIVAGIFVSGSDVESFGEYMADKESLYREAQQVCADLYSKTKNLSYMFKVQKYNDTLSNEIQKASAALANITFEDPKKQEQYDKLQQLSKRLNSLKKSAPMPSDNKDDPNAVARDQLAQQESKSLSEEIKKLEGDYKQVMANWRKQYPADVNLFDASSRVDIPTIQKNIEADQVVLMYTQLDKNLLISAIRKDKVDFFDVAVDKAEVERLIRDEMIVGYVEQGYGRNFSKKSFTRDDSEKALKEIATTLQSLYKVYITPVEDVIKDSKRIYVVNDGLAAQLPFGALVRDFDDKGQPIYLIEEHEVGIVRPSFIQAFENQKSRNNVRKMLAIANADNFNFQMPLLPGTIKEVSKANEIISAANKSSAIDLAIEKKFKNANEQESEKRFAQFFPQNTDIELPTESWLRDKLKNSGYEILYFSTHGMPYSNVMTTVGGFNGMLAKKHFDFDQFIEDFKTDISKANDPMYKKYTQWFRLKYTTQTHLTSNSPLNGLLYLSSEPGDNVLDFSKDIPLDQDGLLTMKEVLQMPESYFANTDYVFLSACNTGVTYVPSALAEGLDEEPTPEEVAKELKDLGLIPGVDQVSFVDTFMRKGVKNVYGTFWFVDDAMSAELLSRFIFNLTDPSQKLDAVGAFNKAQRSLIEDGKNGKEVISSRYPHPQHPFLWAAGGMFGK